MAPPRLQAGIHRPVLFGLGMATLLGIGGAFVVPTALPQETCDAFGSWMACPDGSSPRCANLQVKGAVHRNEKELSAVCPHGPGDTSPIVAAEATVALLCAGIALPLVFFGLKPRRAP